jgi:ABC-type transport system substrate-binding protein
LLGGFWGSGLALTWYGAGLALTWYGAGRHDAAAQDAASTPVAGSAGTGASAGLRVVEGSEAAEGDATRGGTLHLVRPGRGSGNFNPAAFAQDPQIPWSYLEPLVRPDPVTMRPTPWLAQRWEWREDGRELLFMLRDDVVWHDGVPLTAYDAEFALAVYRDDVDSAVSGFFSLVEWVAAEADHALRVRFLERDANWLFNAAMLPIFSRQQHREYWMDQPATGRTLSGFDWKASPPVGTGPWRIAGLDEQRIEFARAEARGSMRWSSSRRWASAVGVMPGSEGGRTLSGRRRLTVSRNWPRPRERSTWPTPRR